MADLSIGAAVGSGFDLIRRKPLTVWSWGAVTFAFVAVVLLLFGAALAPALVAAMDPAAVDRDPSRMIGSMVQMQGVSLLMNVGLIVVQAVVAAAVFRAVIRPEESRSGYMRLGMAEVYVGLLNFGERFAFAFGVVILAVPFVIAVVVLAMSKAVAAAVVVGVLGAVLIATGLIYVALRIALAGPMIVADNQFRLVEAWRLVQGRVGALFLTALLLLLIAVALEVAVFIVVGVVLVALMGATVGGLAHADAFFRQAPALLGAALLPLGLLGAVIGSFVAGCGYAIFYAPWAHLYTQLAGPDPARTFA